MAKYLRPRRGTLANADSQNLLLKKGELFFEYPVGSVGMAPAKLMIGNGITQYTSSNPVTTDTSGSSTNSFAPALVHPVLYRPKFTDSNCATSDWTFNAGTEAISNIKPWVNTSNQGSLLPNIIGNIKQALCNHADSLTKLNNDFIDSNNPAYLTGEVDLNDYTESGIYIITSVAGLTHEPDYTTTEGQRAILKVIKSKTIHDDQIGVTQIMIFKSEIFTRQGLWVLDHSTHVISWGDWITYEDKAFMTNTYVNAAWFNARYKKCGTVVLTFNSGTARASFANFGVTARPDVLLLTAQSQNTWMRYDYDNSASSVTILAGGGISGAVRFCYFVGMNY